MTLHIYRPDKLKRTRRICPFHKKLEYATMAEYYDATYFSWDCGTTADTGSGFYEPPKQYKRLIIFWDNELERYRLFAQYIWKELFSNANLNKIRRIAKERLKKGGVIQERLA